MDIKQALLTRSVDILDSAPLLFDNVAYKYQPEESELQYKLFLVENEESNYVVCALTEYVSDNDFTNFLEAHDNISHPLSLHFYKEFQTIEKARVFYEDVLKQCPTPLDLKDVLPETCEMHKFYEFKSVNHDFHLGIIREDEFFKKEFVRHGYQRIFIRMFRFKERIVINKNLQLVFDSEEAATQTFQLIREHVLNHEFKVYECQNEEMEFNMLLESLLMRALRGKKSEIKVKRDFLERITELDVMFEYKGVHYIISYSLPTRNGNYHRHDMDGVIRKDPETGFFNSSYETYHYVGSFKKELISILES